MPATSRKWLLAGALALGVLKSWAVASATAHPMPDTEITIESKDDGVELIIHVPVDDLALAIPGGLELQGGGLTTDQQLLLGSYFTNHTRLVDSKGVEAAVSIVDIKLLQEEDAEVGHYSELKVVITASDLDDVPLTLHYDGVLHQVANHRAIVSSVDSDPLGIILFNLSAKRATPLTLPLP